MKTSCILLAAALSTLTATGAAAQTEIFSEAGVFSADGDPSANRHVIQVEAGMTVEVIVFSDDLDTTLNATLPNGETFFNDDYDGLNAGFLRSMESGGDLVILAAPLSSGQTGTYRVVARTVSAAGQIRIGETVMGRLDDGSAADHRYALSGEPGDRVVIDLKSDDFDAYLTLIGSDGSELTDDDGGDGYNSRLRYHFDQAETVILVAGSWGSDDTGDYELVVSGAPSPASAQNVDRHEGTLGAGSARGYDGTRYDLYEITATAGEILTVTLDSDDFDTVLYISHPDGSNLIQDDDGGDGANSAAVVTFPVDGNYVIYVTAFSDGTGDYVLTIYR